MTTDVTLTNVTLAERSPATLPPRPRTTPAEERTGHSPPVYTQDVPEKPALEEPPLPPSGGRGWLVFLLIMAALAGTGWYYRTSWWPRVAGLIGGEAPAAKPPARVMPVGTAQVRQADMNIYLNGLGTVTPLKTVTIRSRVEGELINIAFTEGQMVNEGDLLAEIDKRPFELQRDQAAGQLARDEATLNSAKFTLDRYEQLSKDKIISAQQVQEQLGLVQQMEGAIKTDRALIANAELQITYCRITAPVSGRIGLRQVDVGNIVRANDSTGLAVINQIRPITIVFTISQDDIPRVQKRIHEGGEMRVEAYDREMTTRLAVGKLIATDNQVDPATGTLRLKAIVEDDADQLFPNQFVNTRLLIDELQAVMTVPSVAVQRGPQGTFVYVVDPESQAELRMVEVGPAEGTQTVILSGLTAGETVVTEGLDKLQPGTKVSTGTTKSTGSTKSASATKPARPDQPGERGT